MRLSVSVNDRPGLPTANDWPWRRAPGLLGSMTAVVTLLLTLAACASASTWQVVPDSSNVAFVSIKNGLVVEAHSFAGVSGSVDDDGEAVVYVELASVDTGIPIRDERMREMLFEVNLYPRAEFHTKLDLEAFSTLDVGDAVAAEISGELTMHGHSVPVSLSAWVTRVGKDRVQVSSVRPVVVMADSVGLGPGLEALRNIAGLTSITPAVPVTFSLLLERTASH